MNTSQLLTLRTCAVVFFYAFILVSGAYIGGHLMQFIDMEIRPVNESKAHSLIMVTVAIFALTSALPFVPGAEIGIGMMMILGGKIAPLIYLSMVAALTMSFLVGKLVPMHFTARAFGFLRFTKAQNLVLSLAALKPDERLNLLLEKAPTKWLPFLLRNRYLALMLILNIPGNSIIGGGGGIAFAIGLSGLFSFPKYLVAIALAVLPIPAFYYLAV